jgi:hypothetical protein
MALALLPGGAAQGDAVIEGAVVADSAVSPMTTPMPWSMNTRRPIFAPWWISMPVNQRARCDDKRASHFKSQSPQAMRKAVPEDGVQARIGRQHLEKGARGRVAFEDDGGCLPSNAEHRNMAKLNRIAILRNSRLTGRFLRACPGHAATMPRQMATSSFSRPARAKKRRRRGMRRLGLAGSKKPRSVSVLLHFPMQGFDFGVGRLRTRAGAAPASSALLRNS